MRTIMLIDMDYFFVACEEIKRPELRDKPTIVGADPKEGRGRGVVMTCNYVARKLGIHSAMPISSAYRIAPDAEFLPMDYPYYERKSSEAFGIIKNFSERIEQVSIDEFFIDVSSKVENVEDALMLAEKIKSKINSEAKLPCSIGISNTKLVAKMACEKAKPDGIKLVSKEESTGFIWPLSVGELYGVGIKTKEKLEKMGYKTIGDLAKANVMLLMKEFDSFGIELHNLSNCVDDREVVENYEVKSISKEHTFERDTGKDEEIIKSIRKLSMEVGKEVSGKGLSYKTITVKLRYMDFTEHLHSKSIRPTGNAEEIGKTAVELYRENIEKGRKIRKIGIKVSGLQDYKNQKLLFG